MSKKFSQFVQEAHIKSINEEELAELLNDLAEEHDLTEEETQQVLDELFGIGSTLKRVASAVASPFQHVGAWVRGKGERVRDAYRTVKAKSRAADLNAARKLSAAKQAKAASLQGARKQGYGDKAIATGLQRVIDRKQRQADIRKKKAGGGVTASGSAYITHPETGRHVAISHDDAGAIGRGEKKASDVIKAKAPKPKAVAPAPKPKAKAPSSVVRSPRRSR